MAPDITALKARQNATASPIALAAIATLALSSSMHPAPESHPMFQEKWAMTEARPNTASVGGGSWRTVRSAEGFVPKTALARRLWEIRGRIAKNGGLEPAAEILRAMAASRAHRG